MTTGLLDVPAPASARAGAPPSGRRRWAARARQRLGLDTDRPRLHASTLIGVYLVLLLGFPQGLVVRQIGAAGTPANFWGLLLLLWWFAGTVAGHNAIRPKSPVRRAAAAMTVAVLVAYAYSMARGWYAPPGNRQKTDDLFDLVPSTAAQVRAAMMKAADRGLIAFFSWLGVCLMASDGLRRWSDIERCVRMLVTIAAGLAVVGILQYFTGLEITGFYRIPGLSQHTEFGVVYQRSVLRRVMATATHPIEFGVVIAAAFPFALHQAIYGGLRRYWLAAGAIGFAAALSVSRSAVLVLGIALAVLWTGWPRRFRRKLYWGLPVAVIATRIAAPGVVGTLRSLFLSVGQDTSVSGRTEDYDVIFRVYAQSPWLGRGFYTFVPRYYRIVDNQLLVNLVELGLLGFAAFAVLAFVGFFSARGARRRALHDRHRHLCLCLSASIAGLVLSYATFDAFAYSMASGMTFLLYGLTGAAWRTSLLAQPPAGLPLSEHEVTS